MLMPPQSAPPDPYGFIMNPGKPKRPPLLGGGLRVKLLLVAILAIIVIVVGLIVGNILGSSNDAQKERLIEVAQAQTEIVRVSTTAASKANSSDTKAIAYTNKISVQSAANQTTTQLSKYGVKTDGKLLGQGKNAETDKLLADAASNNRYDETYKKILAEQLDNYQKLLKSAFESGGKTEKVMLNRAANSNTLVVSMLKS